MAGRALAKALVRDPDLLPGGCKMAAAAVAGVMVIWQFLTVAAGAVGLASVVKRHILPGGFLVTAAALAVIMVDVLC